MDIEKIYEIRIKNHLDGRWEQWFQAEEIRHLDDGVSVLVVRVPDQPALHGLIGKIRGMSLSLISIKEINDLEERHG